MNINRLNYEEYFILYMDNELSNEERRQVEAFTSQHPDLKEELDILSQYKLEPDIQIVYTRKEELLKQNGNTAINSNNYEEWFSLYADDELNNEEKTSVDNFIAANPTLKREFKLFLMAKLVPEEVVFADKDSLYRKEEKVVYLRWWKIAAAAVILLGIGFTTYNLINKKPSVSGEEGFANNAEQQIQKSSPEVPASQIPLDNKKLASDNSIEKETPAHAIEESKAPVYQAAVQLNTIQKPEKKNEIIPVIDNNKQQALIANNAEQKNNNLPSPELNPNVQPQRDSKDYAIASINNPVSKETINTINPGNEIVTKPNTPPSTIITASNKTSVGDLPVAESDGKKNKLRGFFRKLTRTFEKRTDIDATDEDGKLLVAGFAINLK